MDKDEHRNKENLTDERTPAHNSSNMKLAVQWLNQALYFYQVSSWFKVKCFEVANFWQPQNDIRRDALKTIQGHSAYFEDKDIFYNDPIPIDGYDVRRLTDDGILA